MLPSRRTFLHSLAVAAVPGGAVATRSFAPSPPGGETRPVTEVNATIAPAAAPTTPACDLVSGPFTRMPIGDTEYAALPTITRLPPPPFEPDQPGPLRLAWFQGDNHLSYGTATIMTALSDDAGVTWSTPQRYEWANSLRDPALSTIDGRVMLSYFTGTSANPASGVYVRDSFDGGNTFGTPRRVDPYAPYAASSAPVRWAAEQFVMPWYGRRDGDTHDSAWLSTRHPRTNLWTAHLIADGEQDGRGYAEPWLLVDHPDPASTRLQVFHRYGARDRIGLAESPDSGYSWNRRPLFLGWGKPAAVRMSTGHLVVIYRSISDSSAVYAVSGDDGQSWDHGHLLVPNTAHTDLGMIYAAPCETSPGRLYVVVAMETAGAAGSRLWHGHLECG